MVVQKGDGFCDFAPEFVFSLGMEPGDGRRANTGYTRRKRGKDGRMHDVRPARLTEMRNFIHSVYEI